MSNVWTSIECNSFPKAKTFAVRVSHPVRLPSAEDLRRSIKGIKKRIRGEVNRDKRHQLKDIKRELQWLKDQL